MTILVADVGGTNSRVAQAASPGAAPEAVRSFANAEYRSFYHVLETYVAAEAFSGCSDCVIAMAGPVAAGRGRLTNLDWDISVEGVQRALGCGAARLLNDLTALGYAISVLPAEAKEVVAAPAGEGLRNGQSLVVGIGTGFNVCPVKIGPDGRVDCLEAEAGHVMLPPSVTAELQAALSDRAGAFVTVEQLFSGRGLARFDQLLHTGPERSARQVVEAYEADHEGRAGRTLTLYTRMLSLVCHELALHHMPRDGIHFAGSVARGLLGAGLHPNLTTFHGPSPFADQLAQIPLSVILDDAAALHGCSAAAAEIIRPASA